MKPRHYRQIEHKPVIDRCRVTQRSTKPLLKQTFACDEIKEMSHIIAKSMKTTIIRVMLC